MKFYCECSYCVGEATKSYTWQVSPRLIWVEIPKNASQSIKTRYLSDKTFKMHNKKTINTEYFKEGFVILRDPVSRFKSLLAHYFLPSGGRYRSGKKWLDTYLAGREIDENNLCELVLSKFHNIKDIEEPHHWNAQSSFIPKEFYNLEKPHFLGMDWVKTKFPFQNRSQSELINIADIEIRKIKQLYAEDYNLIKTTKGEI